MKYDRVIGIDPGTKTGLAIWNPIEKVLDEIKTVSVIEAFDIILNMHAKGYRLQIRFEDALFRDSIIWQEFCDYHEIDFRLLPAKYNLTKLEPGQFMIWSGWSARTSEHARNAAVLVLED